MNVRVQFGNHLADVDNPIIQQAIEDSYSFKTGEIYEERKEI